MLEVAAEYYEAGRRSVRDEPTRQAAAQALRDAADDLPWNRQGPERAAHIVTWLRARADRLAATPEDGVV